MNRALKILLIGNYPPPMCGWAMQTKLVVEELRRRGHICEVLKINENRQVKSAEYVDVQSGPDYLFKMARYALRGFQLNVHVNGMSKKGYWLAMAAALTGRLTGRPTRLTFHGGFDQMYFPRYDRSTPHWGFTLLFRVAGEIACDSSDIKSAIERYGISADKVTAIATFSPQYMDFQRVALSEETERFIDRHGPVIFSYVSYRPEYRLEIMREGMARYRKLYSNAGFIWLGFPEKELPAAKESVKDWPEVERESLLILGNLTHNQFLTLLARSDINLRTPACDGVAASVLESLALGIPVVASENGRRPSGVITYEDTDAEEMCAKLVYATEHNQELKSRLLANFAGDAHEDEDNIGRMADWVSGCTGIRDGAEIAIAR